MAAAKANNYEFKLNNETDTDIFIVENINLKEQS
jgi:hypothetical protein